MRESKVNTLNVPQVGSTNPATLFYADKVPMRVVVRNVGGALLLIAHDSNTLQQGAIVANAFRLPSGDSEVFVLAPKQGIFAASAGAGGQASIAVSEAIPNMNLES